MTICMPPVCRIPLSLSFILVLMWMFLLNCYRCNTLFRLKVLLLPVYVYLLVSMFVLTPCAVCITHWLVACTEQALSNLILRSNYWSQAIRYDPPPELTTAPNTRARSVPFLTFSSTQQPPAPNRAIMTVLKPTTKRTAALGTWAKAVARVRSARTCPHDERVVLNGVQTRCIFCYRVGYGDSCGAI